MIVDVSTRRKSEVLEAQRHFEATHVWFEAGFSDWDDARANASGYNAASILEKAIASARAVRDGHAAYERDTVLFDSIQISHALLAWLLYAGFANRATLSVLDFGGALGSSYRQNRPFLPSFEVLWGVVEQEQFVDAGRREFETEELHFFYTPEECAQELHANFALLSGVLQYLPDPYGMLDRIFALRLPWILIDRTMARYDFREEVVLQHVPETIYKAEYPAWMLDARRIEEHFATNGYVLVDKFEASHGSRFGPVNQQSPYLGWLFRRSDMGR